MTFPTTTADTDTATAQTTLIANAAFAPANVVELPKRVKLPPKSKAQPNNWHQQKRHVDNRPGEAVAFELRMIALRRTYGNGLASGQILVRTQRTAGFDKESDFIVTAIFLPTNDLRMQVGVVQDQVASLPYDEGYVSHKSNFWDILEIKVGADQAPWIRGCDRSGHAYQGTTWKPMTVETVQLLMSKPEYLDGIKEFTGLDYAPWKHGEHYQRPILTDKDVSILAQGKHLA